MQPLKTLTACIVAMAAAQVSAAPVAALPDQPVLKRRTISTLVAGKEASSIQLPSGVPASLERRRSDMGLPPMAEYLKILRARYQTP